MFVEDMLKALTATTLQLQHDTIQFQKETKVRMQNLGTQIFELAITVSKLESKDLGSFIPT